MNNEAPWVKLKISIHLIHAHFWKFSYITNLEGIGKVHSSFRCTEDECAGVGPDKELDDGVVRLILLLLCHSQQPGQETVPLVHSVAWEIQGYGDH